MSNLPMRRESPRRRIDTASTIRVAERVVLISLAVIQLAIFVGTGSFGAMVAGLGWLSVGLRPGDL